MDKQEFINKLSNHSNILELQSQIHSILNSVSDGKSVRSALDRLFGGLKINLRTGSELDDSLLTTLATEATTQNPFLISNHHYYFCHLLEAFITSTAYHSNQDNLLLLNFYTDAQKKSIKKSNQQLNKLYKKTHCKYVVSDVVQGQPVARGINLYSNSVVYRVVSKDDLQQMSVAMNKLMNYIYQNPNPKL